MRVLLISRDPNIFREGSESYIRHEEYRAHVEELRIISFGKWFFKSDLSGARGFDIVVGQDPFETGFVAWVLARWYGARLQIQIHTDFLNPLLIQESFKNRARSWIAGFVMGRADCVRAVSERIARSLASSRLISMPRVTVLPILSEGKHDSALGEGFNIRTRFPDKSHCILMASRLTREKNIPLALRAFKRVLLSYPKAGLFIVGDGPELVRLKELVKTLGVEGSVVFEGWSDSLQSYYQWADLYLLTSDYEGYGLTLLEAARAGCPIVTTNVGLVGDLLGPEEAGIVPPRDEDALVCAIEEALSHPEIRLARTLKARMKVTGLPSKKEYIEKYVASWGTCGVK